MKIFTWRIWFIPYVWRVLITVFLKLLVGEARLDAMLYHSHVRLNILLYPFFVVRVLDSFVQTKVNGNVMLQPLDNISINEEIHFKRTYDRFYKFREDDTIIDVGAHVGVFTLRAARMAQNGFIVAIEPHPLNYRVLTDNLKFNKISNVKALALALWHANGTSKLYLGYTGTHSLSFQGKDRTRYLDVRTRTLDTLVEQLGIKQVNYVKIDVEGAELEILRGGEKTLKRDDLFLSIAAYHTPTEIRDISRYLRNRGFRVFVYESAYVYAFKPRGKARTTLGSH